ncbi:hypothetical protein HDV05_007351 [Chytridiales sp. JEL 0842]|nr:hypothetical protein HDV05_007351 [Chytridiales sp. JEL 0842]
MSASRANMNDEEEDGDVLPDDMAPIPAPRALASQKATAMVSRRGSVIILGDSLTGAAEVVNKKAMMERAKWHGDDYKAQVGLAKVKVDGAGSSSSQVLASSSTTISSMGDDTVTATTADGRAVTVVLEDSPFALPSDIAEAVRAKQQNILAGSRRLSLGFGTNGSLSATSSNSIGFKHTDEDFKKNYIEERINKMDASRILLTERKREIIREKSQLRDLGEKERLGVRILDLEREISEKLLESQRVALERKAHEIECDAVSKHVDAATKVLAEVLKLQKKIISLKTARESELEIIMRANVPVPPTRQPGRLFDSIGGQDHFNLQSLNHQRLSVNPLRHDNHSTSSSANASVMSINALFGRRRESEMP